MITADRIKRLAPSARADLVQAIIDNWSYAVAAGITTPRRVRHFMAQICVETGGLRAIEENLSYTAKRIREVWPSRFKTIAAAKPFERNPKALAMKVYSGRNGNLAGTEDGWIFRGSGFMQNTGRVNFKLAGYEKNPDALRTPGPGFKAAVDYWAKHGLNKLADADNITAIRRKINGGKHGLPDAVLYLAKSAKIWPDGLKPAAKPAPKPAKEKPAPAPAPVPTPEPAPAPVAVVVVEPPAPITRTKAQVEFAQTRLRDLGYYEVGEVDGDFGERARNALNAFKADNGLPLIGNLDVALNLTDEVLVMLSEDRKRKVAESRATATAEELAPKSRTILLALRNKIVSMFASVFSFIVAAFYGVVEFFGDAYEKTEPLRNALASVHPAVWFGAAGVIAFMIWWMNKGVEDRVVDDYRTGKKL